jgi:exonuclease VII small subunit
MMSNKTQSRKYEENYAILEKITESLNKEEIGIDDLVEKTREALDAARVCMDILDKQKGEFQKLETEFAQLLRSSTDPAPGENGQPAENNVGTGDPF